MRRPHSLVLPLFADWPFLSATLVFAVQPMFTRMVLPVLGGAPAVWNTAVVFFQGMLLAAYLYAYLSNRFLAVSAQVVLHLLLLGLAFLFLPIALAEGWVRPNSSAPVLWLLGLLLFSIGLPFFSVAATAPLLQRWFSRSGHPDAADPYFLYAASNLGSMLALLAYPIVVEPLMSLWEQALSWTAGYGLLVMLIGGCGGVFLRNSFALAGLSGSESGPPESSANGNGVAQVCWRDRWMWLFLSLVPSAMLLGVTLHISTDVAAVPFMWVIPLSLYLLSFVFVFARRSWLRHGWMLEAQVFVFIMLAFYFGSQDLWLVFGLHLLVLFLTAMVCHGELAQRRPEVTHLNEFYLWMSAGGFVGGVLSTLVAPLVFDTILEYPLTIVAACLLRPVLAGKGTRQRWLDLALPVGLALFFLAPRFLPVIHPLRLGSVGPLLFYAILFVVLYQFRNRPARFALGIAVIIFSGSFLPVEGEVLTRQRSFYGIHEVRSIGDGTVRILRHGTTMHGAQSTDPAYVCFPVTYFNPAGPLGQVFEALDGEARVTNIGVVGLGVGTIACYLQDGQTLTFHEIDPVIEAIARNPRYFRYLDSCGKSARVVIGDGRLTLAEVPAGQYDVLVLDAFSSDSIPVHLITREAMVLYEQKLSPQGVVLFHVSNKYVDLAPVLARLVEDAGFHARIQLYSPDDAQRQFGAFDSRWVVIARRPEHLDFLANDERWKPLIVAKGSEAPLWTDDYSNLFRALIWGRLLWSR